ncbi:alpha/beta hydrolase [Aliifodinibius sp. S!AR15-10]|uniref:alpha/beta fold hydrolase n=1 Tax=Aliifodinibius sp. S!AR15-10 TaxID=2950437 RepID=UPI00285B1F8A|nr:alpha/beta hydrolase [Aliifodinibius sp. S!AR15-10]MDR8393019.1 alpha/beta hydrolase [Aliifodinibius sp. S!AR15-10]
MESNVLVLFLLVTLSVLSACEQQEKTLEDTPVLSADGVEINYKVQGTGSPAVVFVHGWSGDMEYWKQQLPYFSRHYKVVAIDLAGHGESGHNREDWTMAAFGEDVVTVIEKLELDTFILVGHSMGGAVVVEAAQLMPDRVTGLVAVDAFHQLDLERTPRDVENILEPFKKDFARATQTSVKENLFAAASDSLLIANISSDMAAAPPSVALPALRNHLLWKPGEGLPKVPAPIKLINSDMTPTDLNAAKSFEVEIFVMSGVGHFPMLEDPGIFNTLLGNVIQEFTTKAKPRGK